MHKANPFRRRLLVTLLALLLVCSTIGAAWHHHTGSSDSNCSICHLGHQPMDRPMNGGHRPALVLLAPTSDARETQLAPGPVFRRVPARAPPTA